MQLLNKVPAIQQIITILFVRIVTSRECYSCDQTMQKSNNLVHQVYNPSSECVQYNTLNSTFALKYIKWLANRISITLVCQGSLTKNVILFWLAKIVWCVSNGSTCLTWLLVMP